MLNEIFPHHLTNRLHDVESRLREATRSRQEDLDAWTGETLSAGGKRIRPLLLMASYAACNGPEKGWPEVITACAAIEMVHTASLVHDDIMDEAATRRGLPSTYAAHGRDAAILVGDYLFTQAFALGAELPKDAMDLTADACRRLCEGQIRETALHRTGVPDAAAYLQVIRDKTSALLSAACGIGATLAGATQHIETMMRYGDRLGQAFQILDDVLDVTGDPAWTGKPSGSDFIAGTWGSPYIHHAERGGTLPSREAKNFPAARDALLQSGAVAHSQLDASSYTQEALLMLQQLPENDARQSLERLAEQLMERIQ